MTRKRKLHVETEPPRPEHEVVGERRDDRAGRALPFTPDDDNPDIVWATPPVERRLVVQIKCAPCDRPIGAVFVERYTNSSIGFLAEAQRRVDVGTVRVERTRLDREDLAEDVILDCAMPSHGTGAIAAKALLLRAKQGLDRDRPSVVRLLP